VGPTDGQDVLVVLFKQILIYSAYFSHVYNHKNFDLSSADAIPIFKVISTAMFKSLMTLI